MSILAPLLVLSLLTLSTAQQSYCGYKSASNVREHAQIDLDQRDMGDYNDDYTFRKADKIYSDGEHSMKSSGLRTLRGFSTDAKDKLKCEPYFELYRKFYGNKPNYADLFVRSALKGTGAFRKTPRVFRSQCATKGSQYQNVWMYVIHEMEDAINDCVRGASDDNDGGVQAWDEAAAFYCGSLPGPRGKRDGVLIYTLAQKRCDQFGTCRRGTARVNINIQKLLNSGKKQINRGNCDNAIDIKNRIVRQMMVPLIQGVLRYVLLTKPDESQGKAHAEGWAFVSAILPLVNKCSKPAAKLLRQNFQPSARRPMRAGVNRVANALYKTFGCLGITCRDVGRDKDLPRCSTSGRLMVVPGSTRAACKAKACRAC